MTYKSAIIKIVFVLSIMGIIYSFSVNYNNNNKPFKEGETLKYALHYGFLYGGEGTITLSKSVYNDKNVYYSQIYAKTIGLTDKLYKIRDRYESYFDIKTCLPYKAIRDIREGGYTKYEEVIFQHSDSAVYDNKGKRHKVPTDILDILSTLYYVRSLEFDSLAPGDKIDIVTFFDNEIFPFNLRYKGIETVKIKLGKYRCYRFDPVVEPGRIFKSEDDMQVWISADENLIPVRVRFNLIVGAVKCDLAEYDKLKYEFKEEE